VPVVILGVTRVGLVTPDQLRRHRRYAIVACAAIAAFLPGDVITLVLETVPLYLLYEASILVASFVGRAQKADTAEPVDGAARASTAGADAATPTVQQMIDHTDADLSG
jgi:Sec-independent protein secretion pathway component TatC